eukprot:s177_g12.t3
MRSKLRLWSSVTGVGAEAFDANLEKVEQPVDFLQVEWRSTRIRHLEAATRLVPPARFQLVDQRTAANETKNLSEDDVGKQTWDGLKTAAGEIKNISEDVWEGAQKVAKELIVPIVPIAENKILEMDPVDPEPQRRDGHTGVSHRPPSVASASTASIASEDESESHTPGTHGTDSIRMDGSNGSNRIFTDQGVWLFIPYQAMADGEARSETGSDLSRLRPSNMGPQSDSASVFDLSHEFDMAERMAGPLEQVASDSASSTGYSLVSSVPSTEESWLVSRSDGLVQHCCERSKLLHQAPAESVCRSWRRSL